MKIKRYNIKLENNEIEKVRLKNRTCDDTISIDDIIKLKDFGFGNILIDKKSYKTLIGSKLLWIRFDNKDEIIY